MGLTFFAIWLLCVPVCECRSLLYSEPAMYGEVQSPQYPQPYPSNLLQQWDLSVPEGYQIRLTFTHLDIEASAGCYYDVLTVLHDKKVLYQFCGQENSADGNHPGNEPIFSPDNRLSLILKTDGSNPERHQNIGFSAQYQAIDKDECSGPEPEGGPLCSQICLNTLGSYLCSCHHGYDLRSDQRTCVLSCGSSIFDEPEGRLTSPGYPQPTPPGLSCQYTIAVESGFTISLNFSENFHIQSVETQGGPSCFYHWLQVTIQDREPIKLCGQTSPGLIITTSSTVRLDYHTDDEGLGSLWGLDYSTQRVKCPFPGRITKGRVTPVLNEYFYRDHISVRCDQGYKLMMDGQDIEGFSTMCQSNGQWHLPLPTCHILDCGEPEPLLNGGVTFVSGSQNQYLSVIEYHCNEFYSLVGGEKLHFICEADGRWRSDNNEIAYPICRPVCGEPSQHISIYRRIIGGNEAPKDTIPWQVLVTIGGKRGGGMLIDDRWVLTAAHNVMHNRILASNDTVRVHMGSTDVNALAHSFVNVTSIHVHPDYNNPNLLDFNNDIALLKLQERITFYSSVMPICLPDDSDSYMTGVMGLVSGFGITEVEGRQVLTNKLQYVQLPLVSKEICQGSLNSLKTRGSPVPILSDNMFCAGVPEGGKDSCQGDSGGPFAMKDNGRFWAAGIVSWGIECGKPGKYGFYTKISNYVDWIKKTMQEN